MHVQSLTIYFIYTWLEINNRYNKLINRGRKTLGDGFTAHKYLHQRKYNSFYVNLYILIVVHIHLCQIQKISNYSYKIIVL